MDDLVKAVDARELAEQRSKALARFEEHLRELALSPPLERLAAIERELDLIEQYARDTGLFRREETIEFRLGHSGVPDSFLPAGSACFMRKDG
jgi:hypothetical protein